MSFLSEEDKKIADELQAHINGGSDLLGDDLFDDDNSNNCCKNPVQKLGGDDKNMKYINMTSVAISDSNDIRRVIADMLK